MSDSILNSTKKALGLDPGYTAFDPDIVMHINSAFSTLHQLGIGPPTGFDIENAVALWTQFLGDDARFNFVKTYVYLRVRLIFDPPSTQYLVQAYKEQITELEWRISSLRETLISTIPVVGPEFVIDGGSAGGV